MLNLTKGDKLDLVKNDGSKLTNFCVGLNWGAIVKSGMFGFGTTKEAVDLDEVLRYLRQIISLLMLYILVNLSHLMELLNIAEMIGLVIQMVTMALIMRLLR